MQKVLDSYEAGIQVTQVQLQKVDPPTQVIDSLRDVQAARIDLERAQNEAQTYANRVVPEARGRAAQITQSARSLSRADGGRSHRPDRALPQGLRRVQEGAGRHPPAHVSRDHGAAVRDHRQIILDSGAATAAASCPILPLDQLTAAAPQPAQPQPKAGGAR